MKRLIIALLLIYTFSNSLTARQKTENSSQIINLNGMWTFRFDEKDEELKHNWQKEIRYGWRPYGGLYRDVYLEIVPQVYVDNIWTETRQGKEGK
jgi:beta-galactosidase/beta-glucuronidase